jgi:hypothetical protein
MAIDDGGTMAEARKVKVTLNVDTSEFAAALRKAKRRTVRTALWSIRGGLAAVAILASAVGYALGVITTLG